MQNALRLFWFTKHQYALSTAAMGLYWMLFANFNSPSYAAFRYAAVGIGVSELYAADYGFVLVILGLSLFVASRIHSHVTTMLGIVALAWAVIAGLFLIGVGIRSTATFLYAWRALEIFRFAVLFPARELSQSRYEQDVMQHLKAQQTILVNELVAKMKAELEPQRHEEVDGTD